MKLSMNVLTFLLLTTLIWGISCTGSQKSEEVAETEPSMTEEESSMSEEISYSTDDPKSIIKAIEATNGGWDKLWEQGDVEFNYSYKQADGKEDVSVERYAFDSEQSWASYSKHEINVLPDAEGEVIQYYDGDSAFVSHEGELIDNPQAIGGAKFLRKANYFWFVMMYKLDNPGAVYEYLGAEPVSGVNYDKVKISYDPKMTGKEQNDTYILYVNPETKMVDQFYFSLPFLGVNDPVILMTLEYKEVNGLKITAVRNIFMPSEDGYSEEPNLVETSTNITFNNGFTKESFSL